MPDIMLKLSYMWWWWRWWWWCLWLCDE